MAAALSLAGNRSARLACSHAGVWHADQLDTHVTHTLPSGHEALDAELPGGGWPLHALTELLSARPGTGEIRLLAPALRAMTGERRTVVLIAPPHDVYGPALRQLGIRIEHLLVVDAEQAADRLWTIEQTLKSASVGALLAWLPLVRPEQLRRLQLAAQAGISLAFLFRPLFAQIESSPAPLRLVYRPARVHEGNFEVRKLSVEIIKRRGPVLDAPLLLELPQPVAPKRVAAPVPANPHRLPALSRIVADALDRARLPASAA